MENFNKNEMNEYGKQTQEQVSNPERRPSFFRRLLSWVVLILCEFIVMNLSDIVVRLIVRAFRAINSLHEGLFWTVVILGGAAVIGIYIGISAGGNWLVVDLSERVCKSKKGARYIVLGVLMVILYALPLVMASTNAELREVINPVDNVALILNAVIFMFVSRIRG